MVSAIRGKPASAGDPAETHSKHTIAFTITLGNDAMPSLTAADCAAGQIQGISLDLQMASSTSTDQLQG